MNVCDPSIGMKEGIELPGERHRRWFNAPAIFDKADQVDEASSGSIARENGSLDALILLA